MIAGGCGCRAPPANVDDGRYWILVGTSGGWAMPASWFAAGASGGWTLPAALFGVDICTDLDKRGWKRLPCSTCQDFGLDHLHGRTWILAGAGDDRVCLPPDWLRVQAVAGPYLQP